MLGKMYISTNSNAEKLQTALDLTAEALDSKVASDAAGRNALNKLHTALSKAIGDSTKDGKGRVPEGLTALEEDGVEAAEAVQREGTMVEAGIEEDGRTEPGDSLLEELLDDEEEL